MNHSISFLLSQMKNFRILLFILLPLLFLPYQTNAQEQVTSIELKRMTLEELLNVEITVASKTEMTQRESPGIISVITAEEIQNSGAGDLIDVLRLVPGIEMVQDVWGVTGLSIRGNLGYIGRILLMIDGQETNGLFYGCTFLGNHYPVDNIKRIEIIRGPGSAIYGGFAELGVINVITKTGEDLNGVSVSTNHGQMEGDVSYSNANISLGKKIKDFEIVMHGYYSEGNRSNRMYTDVYGSKYDMKNHAILNSKLINTALNYKNLGIRFIYDDYVTTTRDWFVEIVDKDYEVTYETVFGEMRYDWKITDKFTLTPKFNFIHNTPWRSMETEFYHFNKRAIRNRMNMIGTYDLNEKVDILAGIEYYMDNAKNNLGDNFWKGKPEIDYNNLSVFAQSIVNSDLVNVTLGGRIDNHSEYGAAFSPRIGLTRIQDKWHIKLLYNRAFRSPVIDEIHFNYYLDPSKTEPDIVPEKARIVEFETGYVFNEDISLNANMYFIKVDNTIVYSYGEDGSGYDNLGISGTKGFEFEYKVRKNWGNATINYSYYNPNNINEVAYYSAGNKDDVLLGTSPHKVGFTGSYNLSKDISINPSLTYLGERYSYTHYNAALDNVVLSKKEPLILANLYFRFKNLHSKGWSFGVGIYNLFDAEYEFIQPYNAWKAPLPGHGRKLILKLSSSINFKTKYDD